MRGKLGSASSLPSQVRIIPAHAGQTHDPTHRSQTHSDHPRACGANSTGLRGRPSSSGSSPRMRGKPTCIIGVCAPTRIIPAHAGQTNMRVISPTEWPDHPRACGANQAGVFGFLLEFGSSPRMRGKRLPSVLSGRRLRIIPAHAGQTVLLNLSAESDADHPRACGAN